MSRVRLNFRMSALKRPDTELLRCWAHLLSEEYVVSSQDAHKWITSQPQFVADFLNSLGWKVTVYETPVVDKDRILSAGYVVEDPEEMFMSWKLSQL